MVTVMHIIKHLLLLKFFLFVSSGYSYVQVGTDMHIVLFNY